MAWNRWYAFKSYLQSTIWTVPLFAILAEQITFRLLMTFTPGLGGIPGFTYTEVGTIAAMDWVIGSSITYMTFAFGMLLVAIQVSGGQLTPRIVATTLLRNNTIRFSLGLFVYALMLAVSVKLRTERIPPFLMSVAQILAQSSNVGTIMIGQRLGADRFASWVNRFGFGKPTGVYEDFLTGFVASDQAVWARPVGITVTRDGALLVSEDGNGTIWRISYKGGNR